MTTPTVLININGDIRDAASLTIPPNRAFRNAWQFAGPAVEVDMTKARGIQRDRLRAERAGRFAELDSEWFRADEASDAAKKADVAARKKKLRDVTADPRIEAAATPEALQALTLDALTA